MRRRRSTVYGNETAAPAGAENGTLHVAIQISRASRVVGIKSPANEQIGLHTVEVADVDTLRDLIERHRARAERIVEREVSDTPLGQEHLASRFGVSRMPIREAIWQLEALDSVTVKPNRRARVAPAKRVDIVEIFDIRLVAECRAIRGAIPELSNTRLDRAKAIQKHIRGTTWCSPARPAPTWTR